MKFKHREDGYNIPPSTIDDLKKFDIVARDGDTIIPEIDDPSQADLWYHIHLSTIMDDLYPSKGTQILVNKAITEYHIVRGDTAIDQEICYDIVDDESDGFNILPLNSTDYALLKNYISENIAAIGA